MHSMMQNYRVKSFELYLFKYSTGHLILNLGTQTQLILKIYLYQIYYFFPASEWVWIHAIFCLLEPKMTDVKAKIRIETGPPSKEVMIVAEKELRETPERVKEATKVLRELLRGW